MTTGATAPRTRPAQGLCDGLYTDTERGAWARPAGRRGRAVSQSNDPPLAPCTHPWTAEYHRVGTPFARIALAQWAKRRCLRKALNTGLGVAVGSNLGKPTKTKPLTTSKSVQLYFSMGRMGSAHEGWRKDGFGRELDPQNCTTVPESPYPSAGSLSLRAIFHTCT